MKLQIKDLHKSFGENHVLKGISLTAESGKALGLLGRNGAGKTTTIRILLNIFQGDSGEIWLDGKPMDKTKTRIGYLPEERGMYPKKKILDQLVYFAELKGIGHKEAVQKCKAWLERLDLSSSANKRLDTLSKGNQQKVQLITALIDDPDIIVLDEPFSGLDPVNARVLEEVVREQISNDKIIFFSGHQMNYIEEFCDNIAILNHGEIVVHGTLDDIRHTYPRNKLIIRSSEVNSIQKAYGGTLDDKNNLLVTLESEDTKNEVMVQLTKQYDIDEIKVYEPSLTDIFVDYTEGERA